MKKLYHLALFCLPSICCHAEQFTLTNPVTQETFGPVTYSNGAMIAVGDQTLVVHREQTKADLVVVRMKEIIIPRIEFQNVPLQNAVRFLNESSSACDPTGEGVNMILHQRVPAKPTVRESVAPSSSDSAGDDLFLNSDSFFTGSIHPKRDQHPNISLTATNVSLYDALSTIVKLTHHTFSLSEGGIVEISPKASEE